VLNHEGLSEEREMIGSFFLDRQSEKPWEVIKRMKIIRLKVSNRGILFLSGKTNKIWTNLEEL
jgi:hypothetical protein